MVNNGFHLDKEVVFLVKIYKITQKTKSMLRNYYFPEYFKKYNIKTEYITKTDLMYELLGYTSKKNYMYKLINKWIQENILVSHNGLDSLNRPLLTYGIDINRLRNKLTGKPFFKEVYDLIERDKLIFYGGELEIKEGG